MHAWPDIADWTTFATWRAEPARWLPAALDVASLSDEEIVDELSKGGFPVARRTVTKYRKALRIPSSRQRKQF